MKKKILNYISKTISNVFKKVIDKNDNDLNRFLILQSKISSANYILKNCSYSIFFQSKYDLYDFIINQKLIKTQYLEFGVWKGDSINYFSKHNIDINYFGFDSFEGLPESWRPGFDKGAFDLEGNIPKVNPNVKLYKGWFNETIPVFLNNNVLSSDVFLHIDCDIYSSTKDVFDLLGKSLKGEVHILFDEYFNYPFWESHEYKAFQEFVIKNNIQYEYLAVNLNHEQVLVKIML
jgi:hypothetical protein